MTKRIEGTIYALNDEIVIDVQGTASATISVSGTFDGDIAVVGANSGYSPEGGRLLFQSGVGALGSNLIVNSGAAIEKEFRIVTGSERIILRATRWASGSAKVDVYATEDPSTVFVNGPVHTSFEQAVRDGRGYSAGVGDVAVQTGEFLNITFVNPPDSGRNAFMQIRSFQQEATESLVLHIVSDPDPITGTLITPLNLNNGNPASDMEIRYEVDTTALTGASVGPGAFIPANGVPYDIDADIFLRVVPPGKAFGFYVGGTGSNPAQASKVAFVYGHYEEDI